MIKLLASKSTRDYFFTFLVEMVIVASTLYVYRLSSTRWPDEQFSEYAITRRVLSTLQPFLILGMGVAIPRFISMAVSGLNKERANSYFYAAVFIVLGVLIVFAGGALVSRHFFAYVFYGDTQYAHLVFPIVVLITGMLLHTVSYGYYRGRLKIWAANVLQLVNLGIVPLVVFYISSDVYDVLVLTGVFWISFSVLSLLLQAIGTPFEKDLIIPAAKEMLTYGVPRVPGDFLLGFYFSLPVILVNHTDGLVMGGYITVALTFLNMAGAVFTPICLMLLTDTSQLIVKKDFEGLRRKTKLILNVTLVLTAMGVLLMQFVAPFAIHDILKVEGDMVVLSTRLVIVAALGYTVYISLRSVLDAYYIRPVNTVNITLCVALFAISSLLLTLCNLSYVYILCSFVISMFLLGFLTYLGTRKILHQNL